MSANKTNNTASHSSYKKLKKQAKNAPKINTKRILAMRRLKKVLTFVIPAVIVLVIASIITVNLLNDNGIIIRNQTVMESEHFKVDGAMMTYLFWDTVNRELEGDNASIYKMNDLTGVQDINNDSPFACTWKEYFVKMTTETMQKMLTYAHYAISLGEGLNDEDNYAIEEELVRIEAASVVLGMEPEKYYSSYYGRGVNEDDVRRTLRIIRLSNKGMDLADQNITVSSEELDSYYKTNTDQFMCADYLFYVIGISGKDNLTEEQELFYSARAQYIKESASEEEFISRVTDVIKEENDLRDDKDDEKLNATELEEYINSEIESMKFTGVAYNEESSDIDNWIFSSERLEGDTLLNHVDGYGTFGMVYMIKPAYIDENWAEKAEKIIINNKEKELLDSIDSKYVIDIKDVSFNVADVD